MKNEEKVYCETPTPGKNGTNIPKVKYLMVHDAILQVLREAGADGVSFKELPDAVSACLSDAELENLGSVAWHVTSVKLDMEAKGEIRRLSKVSPQRLVLAH